MELKGIKTIVFDLGGVILTLCRDEAVRRFQSLGLDKAEELLDPYHQRGVFLELEEGKVTEEEFRQALCREAGKDIPVEDVRWAWQGFISDTPEYKLTMLEDLRKQGYQLFLLSNTNPCMMDWALSPDFSASGKSLADYFDRLYLSYQIGCVKPDIRIFEHLIQDSGINPAEALFVDDGPANVERGQELGFQTYQPKNGEDFRHIFNQ